MPGCTYTWNATEAAMPVGWVGASTIAKCDAACVCTVATTWQPSGATTEVQFVDEPPLVTMQAAALVVVAFLARRRSRRRIAT